MKRDTVRLKDKADSALLEERFGIEARLSPRRFTPGVRRFKDIATLEAAAGSARAVVRANR